MGERRHAPASPPEPQPAVDTSAALGAIETACGVLDNEVALLVRLRGAQQEVTGVTAQVRALLEVVKPLQARKDVLDAEIAAMEAHRLQLATQVEQAIGDTEMAAKEARMLQAEYAQHVTQAKQAREQETARLEADLAGQRQAHAEALAAIEAAYAKEATQAEATLQAQLATGQAQLAALTAKIEEAEQLREQLTRLR